MGSTERQKEFLARERRLWQAGTRFVAGIDEAGRGALAGPVVAAAVVFDPGDPIEGVDDSKKLTPRKRDTLFDEISARARAMGVGMAAHDEIDVLNIYRATEAAMRRAVAALGVSPALLLVDGMKLTGASCPQEKIIGGDARCYSIAAASIIAKVTRDRIMTELDRTYPEYGFARHKGYGTRLHMQALEAHRACPVHRRTFAPVARQCG